MFIQSEGQSEDCAAVDTPGFSDFDKMFDFLVVMGH